MSFFGTKNRVGWFCPLKFENQKTLPSALNLVALRRNDASDQALQAFCDKKLKKPEKTVNFLTNPHFLHGGIELAKTDFLKILSFSHLEGVLRIEIAPPLHSANRVLNEAAVTFESTYDVISRDIMTSRSRNFARRCA